MLCSVGAGYQPSGWKQQGVPKRWYHTTTLHGVTTQKTLTKTKIFSGNEIEMKFYRSVKEYATLKKIIK
jgi:hypothetical protein